MAEARDRSRSSLNKKLGGAIYMDVDATSELHKRGVSPTDDNYKFIWHKFGRIRHLLDHESAVRAIYNDAEYINSASVGIILGTTSFYAEQGSQISDIGSIICSSGSFKVCDVQVFGGFVVHIGSFAGNSGKISVGDKVTCKTGSIVLPEKLRFDFTHGKPIPPNDLGKIESIVNKQIGDEVDVYTMEATLADAKRINGLQFVPGEEYPDPVRVVEIGKKVEDLLAYPDTKEWSTISTELCGGTHISNTREAKAFVIIYEEGNGTGIRRVTAVTTHLANEAFNFGKELDLQISEAVQLDDSTLLKSQKLAALKNLLDGSAISAPTKEDLRDRLNQRQGRIRKAPKKIDEENLQKAVKVATEMTETAISDGKPFCVSPIDVCVDPIAARAAVLEVIKQKGLPIMVFSKDAVTNKAVACAGKLNYLFFILFHLSDTVGNFGCVTDATHIKEAMDTATEFTSMQLT
ncbi:hypothetical protein MKX03_015747 [Papaver bracteatum]|nr:hypothetical protein MKX03_015747 [Papaver bracteatum]